MKTKELVEFLENVANPMNTYYKDYVTMGYMKDNEEMFAVIIKTLKEYDELKKTIELLRKRVRPTRARG